jgi:hypothetical protein
VHVPNFRKEFLFDSLNMYLITIILPSVHSMLNGH